MFTNFWINFFCYNNCYCGNFNYCIKKSKPNVPIPSNDDSNYDLFVKLQKKMFHLRLILPNQKMNK